MSEFIVIIPARLASSRLPNKPLADIAGKPMVVRVAERAHLSGASRVLVAADHAEIVAACQLHGVDVYLTRGNHPSGTDRIAEAAAAMQISADAVVVNVQCDEPLIDPALIKATAALISGKVPMATAAHPLSAMDEVMNPNIVKVVLNRMGHALYFSRAAIPWHRDGFARTLEQMPADYQSLRHIGLYAFSNAFLQTYPTLALSPLEQIEALEQLRVLWHGYPIAVHITPDPAAPGVDTAQDLERVRQLFTAQ